MGRYGHVRAFMRGVGFCFYIYGTALALLIISSLAVLFVLRQSVAYLIDGTTSLQLADTFLVQPPFWVSAAACLAPLVVVAGGVWFVLNPRSFHDTASRAVRFGLDHAGLHEPIDEVLLQRRLSAFATFVRTFTIGMPVLAVALVVLLNTTASWGTAHAIPAAEVFKPDGLKTISHPPMFLDHASYWMGALANFILIEAPETFNWALSPLRLQDDALHLLTLKWILGLTLVWMVAKYFVFTFNWSPDPRAASLKALMANTDTYVREQWRQSEDTSVRGSGMEQEQTDEERPSDDELRAMVPWHAKLRLYMSMAFSGLKFGVGGFALGFAVFALLALVLLVVLRFFIPDLAAMPFPIAAGISVVPLYLCIEIFFKLVDRGRFERRLAGLYGTVMVATPGDDAGEVPETFESRMQGILRSEMLLAWLRLLLGSFLGLALVFQCLYAAWISTSVITIWPEIKMFAGTEQPTLGAIVWFWLDVPFDVFLLGAPELFGFDVSPLTPDPQNTWFLATVFAFKVVLVAEAINLIFAIWNTAGDVHSEEARNALERVRGSATEQTV